MSGKHPIVEKAVESALKKRLCFGYLFYGDELKELECMLVPQYPWYYHAAGSVCRTGKVLEQGNGVSIQPGGLGAERSVLRSMRHHGNAGARYVRRHDP